MIVLAVVVGVATGGGTSILDIVLVAAEGILFVLMVIFIGSILLPKARKKIASRREPVACGEQNRHGISPLPLAIIVCLGLSLAASFVGLAAIIGAFLAGMAFAEFKDKWPCEEDFHPINEFLVPFFFLFVGISVDVASFGDVLVVAVLVTLLAIATKFIGCGLGARSLGGKSATVIGVGMIPRGEVGIIVASIGLSMAVISHSMFSVVVFMSMATTIVAPPLLTWAFRRRYSDKAPVQGEEPAKQTP
jgi:Kef-type K+ transport system membrane component KefB